tara:strand:- start:3737 stop:3868 length:132 start_codon:yes stop_codon:yes gene_type:complete
MFAGTEAGLRGLADNRKHGIEHIQKKFFWPLHFLDGVSQNAKQ